MTKKNKRRNWSGSDKQRNVVKPQKKYKKKKQKYKKKKQKYKLTHPDDVDWQRIASEDMIECFEERAAICEYHGGLERKRAEYIAYHTMLRKYWSPINKGK